MDNSDIEKLNEPVDASEREPNRLPPPRFGRTFLPIFLILAATSVTAIWTLIVPVYTAKAAIRVRPIINSFSGQSRMVPLYKSFVDTQVSIMRSPTVLQRSLDDKRVQATEWFKGYWSPLDSPWKSPTLTPMERLKNDLSAVHRPNTEIIDISFKARSAADAIIIINTLLDRYISYVSEERDRTNDEIYKQVVERFKALEKEIQEHEKTAIKLRQELEKALIKRRGELGNFDLKEIVDMMRTALEESEGEYRDVSRDIAVNEWRRKRMEAVIAKTKAETKKGLKDKGTQKDTEDKDAASNVPATQPAEVQSPYHRDAVWRRMDIRVKTLQHQIKSAGRDFKPGHPTMVKLAGDLKFAEAMRDLRKKQLDDNRKTRLVIDPEKLADYEAGLQYLKAEQGLLKHRADLLSAEIKKQRKRLDEIVRPMQMLEKENEALRHKRQMFEYVRDCLYELEIKRGPPSIIQILKTAEPSSTQSNDPRVLFTIMALLGSCLAGAICGLIRTSPRRQRKRRRLFYHG
jgi:uncharacterized protein involved in exopolysaccharide biosynthesis